MDPIYFPTSPILQFVANAQEQPEQGSQTDGRSTVVLNLDTKYSYVVHCTANYNFGNIPSIKSEAAYAIYRGGLAFSGNNLQFN